MRVQMHFTKMVFAFLIVAISCASIGFGSVIPTTTNQPTTTAAPKTCPLHKLQENFELPRFLGKWYVLEYVYNKPMRVKDLSCVGFDFSVTKSGELKSNFTFRFPAKTGFFYHVPSYSPVNTINSAVWDTRLRGADLTTLILGTDYTQWAVLAQCKTSPKDSSIEFLSTRILSRTRTLALEDLFEAVQVITSADANAAFRYPVEQGICDNIPPRRKTLSKLSLRKRKKTTTTTTTTPPTTTKPNPTNSLPIGPKVTNKLTSAAQTISNGNKKIQTHTLFYFLTMLCKFFRLC